MALDAGRNYAEATREMHDQDRLSIYDEVAIMNDSNSMSRRILSPKTGPQTR
jgi:hypothetical protein